jgi:hypothetical protein
MDNHLKARITINMDDVPLSRALDLVAAKAGARWAKTFAVHSSAGALRDLEMVLRGDAKLEASGWTNVAPQFDPPEMPNLPGPPGGKGQPPRGPMIFKDDTGTKMISFAPDGSLIGWSSERLVLESALLSKLSGPRPSVATPETTAQVAAAVHGQTTVYYALDPSAVAAGGGFSSSRMVRRNIGGGGGKQDIGDIGAAIAQERRTHRLRELGNSPEEQVEHARQAPQGRMQMRTQSFGDPNNAPKINE